MVVQSCNLSTWEVETGLRVPGQQLGLHSGTLSQEKKKRELGAGGSHL
jgi:hypothetical protein